MRIFQVAINPPARVLPPCRLRVPFYRLPSHRIPVRWYLYRNLLRSAPDATHRKATKLRWAQAERRHCTSPAATATLLRYEHDILSDYLAYQSDPVSLGQPGIDRIEAIRAQEGRRFATERRDTETLQEYHQALAMVPSTYQPRPTPGLVMPTLQNGPLPRLKPQPLHISMLIHRRQQSRDNRVVQQKAWEEMLYHLKHEAAVGHRHNNSIENKDVGAADKTVASIIRNNNRRQESGFRRLETKFTPAVLHRRNVQRRKRPSIMTEQRRKEETSRSLEAIWAAQLERDGR